MRRWIAGVCLLALLALPACAKEQEQQPTTWSTVSPKTSATAMTTTSSATAVTVPTTATTAPEEFLPEDIPAYTQGTTGYAKFESAYIGLGIKLTGDWSFLSRVDINALDNNPSDFLTNGSLRGIGIIDRFTEVWATSDEGDVIKIVLDENAASRPTLEARIAKAATELEGDNELGRVEATLTAVSCAGKMYPGIEAAAHKNGETQYMCMFMIDLGDYTATVHIIKASGDSFDRELAMLYAVA